MKSISLDYPTPSSLTWPTDLIFFQPLPEYWYFHVGIIMITNPNIYDVTTLWRQFLSITLPFSFDLTYWLNFFQPLPAFTEYWYFHVDIIMITNPNIYMKNKIQLWCYDVIKAAHQLLSPVSFSFFHVMTLRRYQSCTSTVVTVMFFISISTTFDPE